MRFMMNFGNISFCLVAPSRGPVLSEVQTHRRVKGITPPVAYPFVNWYPRL